MDEHVYKTTELTGSSRNSMYKNSSFFYYSEHTIV
jgi:hypothetical protein